jgi:hypothetical protein
MEGLAGSIALVEIQCGRYSTSLSTSVGIDATVCGVGGRVNLKNYFFLRCLNPKKKMREIKRKTEEG